MSRPATRRRRWLLGVLFQLIPTTRVYRSQRAHHHESHGKSEGQRGDGSARVRDRPAESPFEREGGKGWSGCDSSGDQLRRWCPPLRAPRQPPPGETCRANRTPQGSTAVEAEASSTDGKLDPLQMEGSFGQLMANQRAAGVEDAGNGCRQKRGGDEQQQPGGSHGGHRGRGPARHDWIVIRLKPDSTDLVGRATPPHRAGAMGTRGQARQADLTGPPHARNAIREVRDTPRECAAARWRDRRYGRLHAGTPRHAVDSSACSRSRIGSPAPRRSPYRRPPDR